jgi:lipoate-protein ligase B
VNINNDIIPFSKIYPCGEADIRVTSVKECTGRDTAMSQVKKLFAYQFSLDLKEWAQV